MRIGYLYLSVVHGSAAENKNGKFMGFTGIEIDDTLPVTVQWHNAKIYDL